MEKETIIKDLLIDEKGEHEIVIGHIIDKAGDYSGIYNVSIDGYQTQITLDVNAAWIDEKDRSTDLSKLAGTLIENYYD
jgi:hypothetical protein